MPHEFASLSKKKEGSNDEFEYVSAVIGSPVHAWQQGIVLAVGDCLKARLPGLKDHDKVECLNPAWAMAA